MRFIDSPLLLERFDSIDPNVYTSIPMTPNVQRSFASYRRITTHIKN